MLVIGMLAVAIRLLKTNSSYHMPIYKCMIGASLSEPLLDELAGAFLWYIYTVFPPLTARASIFFGGPFTRRLLETGAYSRQAFIFTCTIFERARAPFDAQR